MIYNPTPPVDPQKLIDAFEWVIDVLEYTIKCNISLSHI